MGQGMGQPWVICGSYGSYMGHPWFIHASTMGDIRHVWGIYRSTMGNIWVTSAICGSAMGDIYGPFMGQPVLISLTKTKMIMKVSVNRIKTMSLTVTIIVTEILGKMKIKG